MSTSSEWETILAAHDLVNSTVIFNVDFLSLYAEACSVAVYHTHSTRGVAVFMCGSETPQLHRLLPLTASGSSDVWR